MAEVVTAVYEKGVLRPLQPLALQERQQVRLRVIPEETTDESRVEAAMRELVEEGVLTPPPGRTNVAPMTEEERCELADRLGRAPGKPLSEIIIEDREDRRFASTHASSAHKLHLSPSSAPTIG